MERVVLQTPRPSLEPIWRLKNKLMNTKNSIRVSIGLIAIHLFGHTMGHLGWDKPEDAKMQEVVSVMKSHSADFMGATRSMGDYYNGYSLILFVVFGLSIWLLWNFVKHLQKALYWSKMACLVFQ